jgi:uncharacterized cofD-like protein
MRGALEGRGIRPRVVFLEATDDVLIRRFSETRHRHPLGDERGIANSIAEERWRLDAVRADSDVVLDTSDLSLRQLRERLFAALATDVRPDQLAFQLISFGFKFGVPLEADLVFDVRFMQNPYYVAELRPLSADGRGPRVRPRPAGRRPLPRVPPGVPGIHDPGLHRRGQDAPHHRRRLHRRLPSLDRRRRGGRGVAARAGLRACRGLPPRARPDVNLRRWLTPGIGIKRWLVVVFAGLLLLAIAFAHFVRQVTRDLAPTGLAGTLIDLLTLQFLPYALRGFAAASIGVALVLFGAYRAIRVLTAPLRAPDPEQPLVELLYQKRSLARGPRIVAIGGGTGLSTLLRGLKEHTSNLTAIVTVADDGGSSGVLRTELGIPPVGDIRNCVVALADAEPLMSEVLQYRFPETAGGEASGLAGHALGNLLIAGMTAVENGDFEAGIRLMNRILAVRGQVLPVSPTPLTLHARLVDGSVVDGQSQIMRTSGIERVWIAPQDVLASQDALTAIADAEFIVLGPGSLFTSLLPSLLIPAIRDALERATAPRIFVCNVATQEGETTGFDLARHVEALVAHTGPHLVDIVLAHDRSAIGVRGPNGPAADGHVPKPVTLRWPPAIEPVPRLILDDIVDPANLHHHDQAHLAAALMRAFEGETGIRRRTAGRSASRTA